MLSNAPRSAHILSDPFNSPQILSNVVAQHAFCLCGCVGASFAECRAKSAIARPYAPVNILHANPPRSIQMHTDCLICFHLRPDVLICSQMPSDALICSHIQSGAVRCFQILSSPCKSLQIFSNVVARHAFCLCGCVGASFAECRAKSAIARP